jgi:hypothetical protein
MHTRVCYITLAQTDCNIRVRRMYFMAFCFSFLYLSVGQKVFTVYFRCLIERN